VFADMHDASALVAGDTLAAVRAVWTGTARHGASIADGLHHAMRASASGFCVYNDRRLRSPGCTEYGGRRITITSYGLL
jgi:acetoin utilization protein AcuC